MSAMLEVRGLDSGYGRIPILNAISLTVAKGEFLGIWGHNGMGKSTLMRALMGYLPAHAGTIVFEGKDITHAPTHQRVRLGMGFVPQGREIFPALSVMDNLLMGCAKDPGDPKKTVDAVLEDFPRLKPLLGRVGGLLSGGEQQLLALARCLCGHPKIVLLDEPTEGIQPSIIEEMIATLHQLRERSGLTMILVEQNRDFISGLAQRVIIMQKGAVARETTPQAFHDEATLA
ncbi:MAG: ABC transporter ATP-binding protein [Burkholderiales bacterium]|jgi:branched-chain amino acid transport system ATP-binding protein